MSQWSALSSMTKIGILGTLRRRVPGSLAIYFIRVVEPTFSIKYIQNKLYSLCYTVVLLYLFSDTYRTTTYLFISILPEELA